MDFTERRPWLVTGFEAFLGSALNPSLRIVEALRLEKGDLETLILPVSFQKAFPLVRDWVEARESRVGGVLMFGQAGGRQRVSLERVALNWVETSHPDEDGERPAPGRILSEGPDVCFCDLPLESWKDSLEARGVPCEVSLSAGGFVCNHLFYQTARLGAATDRREKGFPALFVHVPFLPEQALDGQPSLPFEKMMEAARFLVNQLLADQCRASGQIR